ncbi:thiolase family protein [Ancylobacter lacus]|uniref:thiolase family protein n=1 Tax=Ancylobacter lacus TaxID=2579970 RepID=UPI001BCC176F|nr:thiolase family protein [Ancylobacter lacus]
MSGPAVILAARRTAVAPRGGAFADIEPHRLAAPVLAACLADAGLEAADVDEVILGNALSGGGNVARLAALAAGLPEDVPALTLDTQCCSGLDAVLAAARLVETGGARAVLAGGVESFSRSPLRAHRPRGANETPDFYDRPAFAPWPERDPDPLAAMAAFAAQEGIRREVQHALACGSHAAARAAAARLALEIVPVAGLEADAFTRPLTPPLCRRAPVVAGEGACALDASVVAVEADAAAALLVVSRDLARALAAGRKSAGCTVVGGLARGGPPEWPFAALPPAVSALLARTGHVPGELGVVELMESSAVQALANRVEIGVPGERVNRGGGALARGHPIGASGAILAVRLFQELVRPGTRPGALGLAAIPAAGGLATALMLARAPAG